VLCRCVCASQVTAATNHQHRQLQSKGSEVYFVADVGICSEGSGEKKKKKTRLAAAVSRVGSGRGGGYPRAQGVEE
jgi:hypothetical protein